jgi:D-psicose/D-tagatose/L-ribulose 3-epimerase
MKLGIHAYAWCSAWSNETLALIDRVASLDLDFIEIPLMRLDLFDAPSIRRRLESAGIDAVCSTVLQAETDITHEDPAVRRRGLDYLIDCVKAAAAIGADSFSGVIYAAHCKTMNRRPDKEDLRRAADVLLPVAECAADHGVRLGLEPVNRYETFLINTCSQARYLMEMIGHDNIKIHLDTYHMNIEEKSFAAATRLAGADLLHYHLCENDRGIPGTGLVDWDGIFAELAALDYRGYAALESFVDITDNMNTWVWRQLAPSGDTLLQEGAAFIRAKQREYGLTAS